MSDRDAGERRWLLGVPVVGVAVASVAAVLLLAGGRADGRCSPEVREPLDPRALQHVLPGAPAPSFETAAPTSGPHQAGVTEGGVFDEPIPPVAQVGALETGAVLLQHRPDLRAPALTDLRSLATGRVIVAPNPGLSATVEATAWQVRLRCSAVDVARLRGFVRTHAGAMRAPGHGTSSTAAP